MKVCKRCLAEKRLDEYSKHRAVCKACRAEVNSERLKERYHTDPARKVALEEWRKANPERVKAYRRKEYENNRERYAESAAAWKKDNPQKRKQISRTYKAKRKGWEANGYDSEQDWIDLLGRYGNICLCCKRDDVPLTQDHIVPLSKGGTNTIDNIQPLCGPCNSSKHTKSTDYRPNTFL